MNAPDEPRTLCEELDPSVNKDALINAAISFFFSDIKNPKRSFAEEGTEFCFTGIDMDGYTVFMVFGFENIGDDKINLLMLSNHQLRGVDLETVKSIIFHKFRANTPNWASDPHDPQTWPANVFAYYAAWLLNGPIPIGKDKFIVSMRFSTGQDQLTTVSEMTALMDLIFDTDGVIWTYPTPDTNTPALPSYTYAPICTNVNSKKLADYADKVPTINIPDQGKYELMNAATSHYFPDAEIKINIETLTDHQNVQYSVKSKKFGIWMLYFRITELEIDNEHKLNLFLMNKKSI